jgi:Pyridoxal-phosphate dependent enzyme/Aldo/keto reductase family
VPRIALGCGNFGGVGSAPEFFGQGLTEDQAFELMDAAWESGLAWFDTADAYGGGRSEQAIGRWIRSRGVRPQLTTKTFNPMRAGADHGLKPDRIARQLHSSLERLGVDRVELYLAHDYDLEVPLARGVIELADIQAARARIAGPAVRTPLVRLYAEGAPAEIYLKCENLQPVNSFKIRGAANAVMLAPASVREKRLVTASAGNMAQGIAWMARALGVRATIAVPDHAPEAKLAAIERLGGRVLKIPYDDWWNAIVTSHVDGVEGLFVHPVQDRAVMAGNGTIGLEILEDLPDPDAVVIPYGGGGLTTGIASAVKALRPATKIITAEPDTAAALAAAPAAGHPADVDYRPS